MQHGDIWRGIDLLAKQHGLSTSGLAKLAGLDATAFNKSKRVPKDGRPRWPSTESISRILQAVDTNFEVFAMLVAGREAVDIPLLMQSELNTLSTPLRLYGSKTADLPKFVPPKVTDIENCFALQVEDDTLSPVYAQGERLIASLGANLVAGDRVIAKPLGDHVLIGTARTVSENEMEIDTYPTRRFVDPGVLEWAARILWVSQ